jgi:DNA-binding response OmpR family regulator
MLLQREKTNNGNDRSGLVRHHAKGPQQEWLLRQHAARDSSSVLIVEDELLIALLIEDVLEDAGFGVETTYRGEDAVTNLDQPDASYSCLVTDIDIPYDVDGWEVAKHARERWPTLPVVYVTAAGSSDWQDKGVDRSVVVQKPFAPEELVSAIRSATAEGGSAFYQA